MLTPGAPELLHFVGYLTGATLYAMLLAMVLRAAAPMDRLALVTAVLGLAWNVGELSAHLLHNLGLDGLARWFIATSYGALGLLAAVVVHSVSQPSADADSASRRTLARTVAAVAYSCALGAAVIHLWAAAQGELLPSPPALYVVTGGLIALTGPLVVVTRRQANSRRAFWMMALAVFAVSALHVGRFHGANESWGAELLGHHASIPLAFAILYEDYRFALADLFLKQALTLIAVVAAVLGAYAIGATAPTPVVLALWVATVFLFPWIRRTVIWFVDRVVLTRANYGVLSEHLGTAIQRRESPEDVLTTACECLAPALSATSITWREQTARSEEPLPAAAHDVEETARHWSLVPIVTTDEPHYMLEIGPLAGGRRLLSDDLAILERAAMLVARRIDALRLTSERYERMLREREMRTLATEAELRALRAQINPHFLFNALTTIGYLIQSAPPRALETLMRLTTLLRAVLRSEGEFTSLGRERELIECYLKIERERFEERLVTSIDIPTNLENVPIPSLIVQPLVENAIKHGIARARAGGSVTLMAQLDSSRGTPVLRIVVRNTGGPLVGRGSREDGGIGLRNVRRRLQCYYGDSASLTLSHDSDGATLAELRLPADDIEDLNATLGVA